MHLLVSEQYINSIMHGTTIKVNKFTLIKYALSLCICWFAP